MTEKDKTSNANDTTKIREQINRIQEQLSGYTLADQLAIQNSKLIDCKHEIVITVVANILAQNDDTTIVESKEICQKNYHIPVPANKDYQAYLQGFFNFLEKCMSTSAENMEK